MYLPSLLLDLDLPSIVFVPLQLPPRILTPPNLLPHTPALIILHTSCACQQRPWIYPGAQRPACGLLPSITLLITSYADKPIALVGTDILPTELLQLSYTLSCCVLARAFLLLFLSPPLSLSAAWNCRHMYGCMVH